ncbi:hypothetical protein AHAS_Ahas05G0055400 [Arachis hypogaea]|uniref:DUF8040 domain-containing protein n=1 Tax=Arachis hypogaea TaxID=3818 RepID=A0A445D9D6_ARAHY|nr:hypothetical protein Ahy_A05g025754 [Arachis hypogaea]
MGLHAFLELCEKLRETSHAKDTIHVTLEEQVTRFSHIIAYNVKNRTISFFFHRTGETNNHSFHVILRAVISFEKEFLQQPLEITIASEILHSNKFYPYFKNCIGAIDETHQSQGSNSLSTRICSKKNDQFRMYLLRLALI